MTKAIDLSKEIIKDISKDWMQELEDRNLHFIFGAIYNIPELPIEDKNRIICFIILAYSPGSLWLDLNRDRYDNKKRILDSLAANTNEEIYKNIITGKNDIIGMCTFNFLEELKDWRWPIVFNLLDYSAKMQRFANKDTETEKSWDEINKEGNKETLTEELDLEKIAKINKEKGNLLQQSIEKREQAEKMLDQIRKDFLLTNEATQADFDFKFSETSKKVDILSWRTFIKQRNEKKLIATN